jgi:glycerol uptake facilitator-like aquaporin
MKEIRSSEFGRLCVSAALGTFLLLAACIGAVAVLNSAAGQLEPAIFLRPVLIVCAILGLTGVTLNIHCGWRIQNIKDQWIREEAEREASSSEPKVE